MAPSAGVVDYASQVAGYLPTGTFLVYQTVAALILGSEQPSLDFKSDNGNGTTFTLDQIEFYYQVKGIGTLENNSFANFTDVFNDTSYCTSLAHALIIAWTVLCCVVCFLLTFTDSCPDRSGNVVYVLVVPFWFPVVGKRGYFSSKSLPDSEAAQFRNVPARELELLLLSKQHQEQHRHKMKQAELQKEILKGIYKELELEVNRVSNYAKLKADEEAKLRKLREKLKSELAAMLKTQLQLEGAGTAGPAGKAAPAGKASAADESAAGKGSDAAAVKRNAVEELQQRLDKAMRRPTLDEVLDEIKLELERTSALSGPASQAIVAELQELVRIAMPAWQREEAQEQARTLAQLRAPREGQPSQAPTPATSTLNTPTPPGLLASATTAAESSPDGATSLTLSAGSTAASGQPGPGGSVIVNPQGKGPKAWRWADLVHACASTLVLAALALVTPPVSTCLYPTIPDVIVRVVPPVMFFLVPLLFTFVETPRNGLGFSTASAASVQQKAIDMRAYQVNKKRLTDIITKGLGGIDKWSAEDLEVLEGAVRARRLHWRPFTGDIESGMSLTGDRGTSMLQNVPDSVPQGTNVQDLASSFPVVPTSGAPELDPAEGQGDGTPEPASELEPAAAV